MITSLKLRHRLLLFLGIGGTATIVQLSIVYCLVSLVHMQALVANIFGYLIAFNVSFFGHKYLTFSHLHNAKILSLPHFFLVVISGGILNETLYFLLLRYTHLNYMIALVLVLGSVAVYSFLMSRFWACR